MGLTDVMDRWKDAVDTHDPERVASNFTEDAIFQGLHPYGVGRAAVAEYYDSQPIGLKPSTRFWKRVSSPRIWSWAIWKSTSRSPTGRRSP